MQQSRRQRVIYRDLGRIGFEDAWALQAELNSGLIQDKRSVADGVGRKPHTLLFCEHHPVYTLGKSGDLKHLLLDDAALKAVGAKFIKINRGGDITFHGPGQLVGYPILDLERFFTDVHKYVRSIEECVIKLLDTYGLEGRRLTDYTGVWLHSEAKGWRKICAIGVHLSRWVTMHGFALNVNTDLHYFENIVPCGISDRDKSVTSLSAEVGGDLKIDDVKSEMRAIFADVFEFDYLLQEKQPTDGNIKAR